MSDMEESGCKIVLAVSSEVGVGAVGLSIARLVFAAQSVEAICLPSIILASRPDLGGMAKHEIPAEVLREQLEALEGDGWFSRLDGIMTGYFASPEQVEVMAGVIKKVRAVNGSARILVDPVLGDVDTGLYVSPLVAKAVRDLLVPLADVVTPNIYEFCWLCGIEEVELADISDEFTNFLSGSGISAGERGEGQLVVTSARIRDAAHHKIANNSDHQSDRTNWSLIETALFAEGEMRLYESKYQQECPKGTGDVFAAHLLSRLVKDEPIGEATAASVRYLENITDKARGMKAIAPYLVL